MTRGTVRAWYLVHKWTSIVCTAFLLMLCITGLPLIFHEEIDRMAGEPAAMMTGVASAGTDPRLKPLDGLLARSMQAHPGDVPLFMSFDDESPIVFVTTAPTADAKPAAMHFEYYNRLTGEVGPPEEDGVMHFLFQLHADMFLGLPGMLFLGLMGLLFTVALVSGVVLYAPFMRKLDFGTIRASRSRRVKWLDYHNLIGVVTLAWAAIVGLTGVVNTLGTPIIGLWQANELSQMTAAYAGKPALPASRFASIDRSMAAVRAVKPDGVPQFIAFPGTSFSSKHHYAVFLKGDTPATERLLTPALVDAETAKLTTIRSLPWYAQALLVSQPLHFGDYGGLPLKILWALLDILTIVVLGSGLYLWLGKRRSTLDARVREVETGGVLVPAE